MRNLSAKNIFGNFTFGKLHREDVGVSFNGIAVRNKEGKMVSLDGEDLVDVDLFNFTDDNSNFMFAIPVATNKVEKGDVVIHNNDPVFVKDIEKGKNGSVSFRVINPVRGEEVIIKPTKNMFGFNFVTKIYSLFSFAGQTASKENPFGDILPFILLSKAGNNDSLLPLMLMNQGKDFNLFNLGDNSNPMMSLLLMKSLFNDGGSDDNDFFTLMMLQNMTTKMNVPTEKIIEE